MSNTRRPRWTAAQITAANAEQLLGELAEAVAVGEDPVTRPLLARVWDVLDAQGRADEFPELVEQVRAGAARAVVMRRMVAGLEARGAASGLIAAVEREAMGLGDEFWAEMAEEFRSAGALRRRSCGDHLL